MLDAFVQERAAIAEEISWQMGRPVAQSPVGYESLTRPKSFHLRTTC